jgi:transposase InsO family protein
VLDFLDEIGPAVGLPTLQASFPALPRAELHDLLGRYRRVWQTRHQGTMHVLEWTRPGSVWAVDFAEAPSAIDGTWPYLLAVRDLASGQQLLWLPVGDETAATALRELELLWTRWGAPLVLKADNGSAFVAAALKRLACVWGVQLLYSPPWRPSYNGAVEAGIGALKTRTHWQACQAGPGGLWTSAAVEAAREQGNQLARPWGPHGASPEQVWQGRAPLGAAERESFRASVAALEQEERGRRGWAPEQELGHTEEASVMREAIRRALVAHNFLLFTRRSIPLPIRGQKAARIM